MHKAFVVSCAHPRCKTRPLVLYEQFFRTDLRTAEKMARERGWLKVANDWYCSPAHAAVAYLEVKRARSAKRAPRAAETAHVTEETLVAVAAGRGET